MRGRVGLMAVVTWAVLAFPAAAPAQCGLVSQLLAGCAPPPAAVPPPPDPGGRESPDAPVPPAGKRVGFNSMLSVNQLLPADQEAALAARAGATAHRIAVEWRFIEYSDRGDPLPGSDGDLLDRLDALYGALVARGITPVMHPVNAPVWASRYAYCIVAPWLPGCDPVRKEEHPAGLFPDSWHLDDWRDFVRAVALRYPKAVIEGWNEPNLTWGRDGGRTVEPEDLARIQCQLRDAAKGLSPQRTVLGPSLADIEGSFDEYMRRAMDAGIHGCWDAFNLHLYTDGQLDFGAGTNAARVLSTVRSMRSRYGDTDPIWVTEVGFTTSGAAPDAGHQDRVSEAQQADGLRRLYNRLITMDDVAAVILHTLRDQPARKPLRPADPEYGFGLLRVDATPKPAYCHFARAAGSAYAGC